MAKRFFKFSGNIIYTHAGPQSGCGWGNMARKGEMEPQGAHVEPQRGPFGAPGGHLEPQGGAIWSQ